MWSAVYGRGKEVGVQVWSLMKEILQLLNQDNQK